MPREKSFKKKEVAIIAHRYILVDTAASLILYLDVENLVDEKGSLRTYLLLTLRKKERLQYIFPIKKKKGAFLLTNYKAYIINFEKNQLIPIPTPCYDVKKIKISLKNLRQLSKPYFCLLQKRVQSKNQENVELVQIIKDAIEQYASGKNELRKATYEKETSFWGALNKIVGKYHRNDSYRYEILNMTLFRYDNKFFISIDMEVYYSSFVSRGMEEVFNYSLTFPFTDQKNTDYFLQKRKLI
ncbi:MAG: hypothetical protein AAF770_01545 [Bacteroidota bacterium]